MNDELQQMVQEYRLDLQEFMIDTKHWKQEGMAGGMGYLEEQILNRLSKHERRWMQAALKECADGYEGSYLPCRQCGKPAKYKKRHSKRVNTLQQEHTLRRAYYYCYRCGEGFCPLDQKLGIDSQEVSPRLRKLMTELGSRMPFEPAARVLWETRRVATNDQSVRRVTQRTGWQIEEHKQQLWRRQADLSPAMGRDQPQAIVLYTGGDATSVNIRGEGWKQPKVAVSYEQSLDRIIKRRYVAGFFETDEFARRWKASAEDLRAHRKAQVVALQDGADWLWKSTGEHFPGCVQIVDWYHAKERLFTIGRHCFGQQDAQAQQWSREAETLLWEGRVEGVVDKISKLKPKGQEARDYVRQSRGYYQTHGHRMDYLEYRKKEYNIGSGPLEGGGCKNVVGDRLKRTGMRWSRTGAHDTLQARAALLDETIGAFWKERYLVS